MGDSYFDDCKVDKHNLDEEYEEAPSIYMYWAEKAADALAARMVAEEKEKTVRTEMKKRLDTKRAELDKKIRDWETYGLDKKPTEAQISNLIISDDEFIALENECSGEIKKVVDERIQAVRDEEVLKGARAAMKIKKESIEGLERLFLRDYFPRQSKEGKEKKQEKIKEEQSEGLKQNRRIRRRG